MVQGVSLGIPKENSVHHKIPKQSIWQYPLSEFCPKLKVTINCADG